MKKTKLQLMDERRALQVKIDNILATGLKEVRKLTDEEDRGVVEARARIEQIDVDLRNENPAPEGPINTRANSSEISIVALIRDELAGVRSQEVEALIEYGARMFEDSAIKTTGIAVPMSLRAMTAGTSGEIIEQNVGGIIDALRAALVLNAAGANVITGLVGNVKFPKWNDCTASWEDENTEVQDSGNAPGSVELSPKRLTATVKLSKQLIMQSSASVEQYVRKSIVAAIANKLEATILSTGAGSTKMPQGLLKALGANDADATGLKINGVVTYKNIVNLETEVAAGNGITGTPVYITNPAGRGLLKTTPIADGQAKMICENGEANGCKVLATSNIPKMIGATEEGIIFGDFSQMIIGQWGAMDIEIENKPRENAIYLTINSFFDYGIAHSESFVAGSIK